MKRLALFFVGVAAMVCTCSASGQTAAETDQNLILPATEQEEGKTEVCVSYGSLPAMRFIPAYHNHWERMNPWGDVAISIDHRFAKGFWMGFSYTVSSASSNKVDSAGDGSITWHSLMLHARYEYWRSGRWKLYSSIGMGVLISYIQPEDVPTFNRTQFAFQVSPVGASFRVLNNLDLFGEAGFGVQGITRLGFRIDF